MSDDANVGGDKNSDLEAAIGLLDAFKQAKQDGDKASMVAALMLFNQYPDALKREAKAGSAGDLRVGRRVALRAEGTPMSELFIKATLCGSGYKTWVNQQLGGGWVSCDSKVGGTDVLAWINAGDASGPELMFSGPLDAKGAMDTGSNSIQRIEESAVAVIDGIISKEKAKDSTRTFRVLIRAHSRGGVAGTLVATSLQSRGDCKVELTVFDPVPGPESEVRVKMTDASPEKYQTFLEQDIGALDESTLIYSISAKRVVNFTPEKVFGADRIIISRQDHSVGLVKGFYFDGQVFKGTGIANLPRGVFVDRNASGENKLPLELVTGIDDFTKKLKSMWSSRFEWTDADRAETINEVVKEYYG